MVKSIPLVLILLTFLIIGGFASQYTDYVQCVEQRRCGLFSVCGFTLLPPQLDTSITPSSNRKEYGALSGYLMRVQNGLSERIEITWDILGSTNTNTTCTLSSSIKRTFNLTGHDVRYFNTHCKGLHTIRLQVGNDTTDTEIANPDFSCTSDQACEYLVRACFANNDDPLCLDYAYYCQAVLKYSTWAIDTLRQTCIPDCLADFYQNDIVNPYDFKSDEIVKTMLMNYYKSAHQEVVKTPKASMSEIEIILVVLGIAIGVIIVFVAIFIYIRKYTKLFRPNNGRV